MRIVIVFLIFGLIFAGLAAHGLVTDSVYSFERTSRRELIESDQSPVAFTLTVIAYAVFSVFFLVISAFSFVASRRQKAAEVRFFRQRRYLAPTKD